MSETSPTPDPRASPDLPNDVFADAKMVDAEEAMNAAPASEEAGDIPDHAAIDELLKQANFENPQTDAAMPQIPDMPLPDAESLKLPSFEDGASEQPVSSIDLLRDVELNVKIELGRSRMLVEDVLKLGEGSVVELDKLAGDPVDVFVNDRLVARGEVLVLNDNFCVRVNEIVAGVKDEGL